MKDTYELNYSWLRQDKEPESSYKWFTYYRDMKGARRLNKVVSVMKDKEPYLERYPTYNEIKKASSNWKWRRRTIDYDNYLQIQLIETHKQTLITYEDESILIDKKIYNALNIEIDRVIKNNDIPPDKKIKCLHEAQKLNHELLSNIEHIANTEIPKVKYIDVAKTREEEIVNAVIDNSKGIISADTLNSITDGYSDRDVKNMLHRTIKKRETRNIMGLDQECEQISYKGESFFMPM